MAPIGIIHRLSDVAVSSWTLKMRVQTIEAPSQVAKASEFGSGKVVQGLDPGPVSKKHGMTAEHRAAAREEKKVAAVYKARTDLAAAAAARDLSVANVGVVRSSLFDADDWKREHQARESRMESIFGRLYRPQANSYWTQPQKPPMRKPAPVQLPNYSTSLPAALSLAHPSSREIDSDDEDDEPEPNSPPHPSADFDPLAEPRRFYTEFKGRVAALRGDVKAPNERNEQISMQPRLADAVVAAATRPVPPKPAVAPPPAAAPSKAPEILHASWALSALAAPILDEDFDVEPSLVYTDSAHYLADHGVQIPMWDELDGELAALDVAHAESLRALAEYSDPRNHQRPTAGAKPPPVKPGARISSV